MIGLDWMIVAFIALMAVFGMRQGVIVGALSFGGFALGAFLGTRLGPLLLDRGSASPYAPAFGLLGGVIIGALLAMGLEGIGIKLKGALKLPGLGLLDGVLGASLSSGVGFAVVWILAAILAQTPGHSQLRSEVQRSVILRALNELLPPSGPILDALARLDPLPQISGPSPDVAPPEAGIAKNAAIRASSHSVVRVLGSACGLAIEGSGWVIASDLVLTNAHVIAGEHDTTVQAGSGAQQLPARPVAFDPINDLAILQVPDLGLPALKLLRKPASGSAGAIIGYPENGPLTVTPGRIGSTQQVSTQDAYGRGHVLRLLTPLRGEVRSGNSGGPLLDKHGAVLTTVFAATTGAGPDGGFGVANATVAHLLGTVGGTVSSGQCTSP